MTAEQIQGAVYAAIIKNPCRLYRFHRTLSEGEWKREWRLFDKRGELLESILVEEHAHDEDDLDDIHRADINSLRLQRFQEAAAIEYENVLTTIANRWAGKSAHQIMATLATL